MPRNASPSITKSERTCSVPDCDRSYYAKGWCNMHYNRVRKHGHPRGGLWWLAARQRRGAILDEMREAYAALRKVVEK